jgi:hypothetical protein
MLTHVQRAKTWQLSLCAMCVNKIYGSGKCYNKENKEADAFEAYQKEIQLFVNKVGFWEDASEYHKVSTIEYDEIPIMMHTTKKTKIKLGRVQCP